ncbi:UDP-N-acetylmuramoyl-tripeptide--D-alanyl-D-alanine ligase [subsurface metagenome]
MNFKVVAITGSAGKTTTRQIVHHVLSRYYRCYQAPKNFNNNIGLPLTVLGAGPEEEIVIAELGSNHPGEISYLTRIAQPDIAVVTNVYPSHLEGFGDLQTIIAEKLSISEGLRQMGDFVINADCEELFEVCRASGKRFSTFGKRGDWDILAENISYKAIGSRFTTDGVEIVLPLPGPGNVENALAAWSVCSWFGIGIDEFALAVKSLPAIAMRAELLQTGTLTILNDCYNANPVSMKNALDILAKLGEFAGSGEKRRLVFICGDMAELGEQTEQLHTELGACIAQAKVQLLLAVGNLAKIAAEVAKESAEYDLQTKFFEDTVSACNNLGKFIKDYDIVLVKGSRVAKLEMAVEKLKELFS